MEKSGGTVVSGGVLCALRVKGRERESEIGRGRRLGLERAQKSKARGRKGSCGKWGAGRRRFCRIGREGGGGGG